MISPRSRLIALSIALTYLLLAWCSSVFALDPALDVSQYAHTSWKIREGFAKSRISAMAQTPDGYLWLGTDFGVLRFDGVRAVPWQPPADQPLPSNTTIRLLAAGDGTLWIGTDKGLASWNGSKLTQYPELAGQFVFALLEDPEGTVWIGTYSLPFGKLCKIQKGSVQCSGENGEFGRGVLDVYEDRSGNLWVGSFSGVWRWKPGPSKFYPLTDQNLSPGMLGEGDDGALLIGMSSGIQRLVDGKVEPYPLPKTEKQFKALRMLRDRDGSLWFGTSSGVAHVHQGRTDVFSSANGLSGDLVSTMLEDREGNIWVATPNGLDRFRDFAVPTFSISQGSSNVAVWSALATTDGSILVATNGGLKWWNNGQFAIYGSSTSQGQPTTAIPQSLFQDSRGRIWLSTPREFGYLNNERVISISTIPGGVVRSIAEDAKGDLWIANQNVGLFHLLRDNVFQQFPWDKLGHKDFAAALAVDPLHGGLWLGFFQGGVAYFKDGKIQATYSAADGLGAGRVDDLRMDQDGTLWVSTESGLSRLKNNRVSTLSSKNGLPCDSVHWMIEDNSNSFWLDTTCGLVRIAHAELDAWAGAIDKDKNAKRSIQATVFDSSDGARSIVYPFGFCPPVAKAADGKLWFATVEGVSVIDPRRLAFNRLPPPVNIEQITADRKTYNTLSNFTGPLRLPPLIRDLQIDYTALSLVAPEKVLFRYKLEGYDRDWQDAGTRRQAFYSSLPPRNYRFRVIACNNSGVWNEAGTFLDFSIAPAYYQTRWFRLSIAAAFLVMLAALYQVRVRYLRQQFNMRLEERVNERTRIARELHDTLLQSVQGLILKFHAATKQIPDDQPARQILENAIDRADEVLAEGRDRVRDLRSTALSLTDLPDAFRRVAEETPQGHQATFKTFVEGNARELDQTVLEESYRIGREAIINALKHSNGRNVEVEITYDSRQFRLRVRDDGRGIDREILEDGGRPDHFGLQGMRERADKIGARLQFWSRPESGTEVELIVPAATAYQNARAKS